MHLLVGGRELMPRQLDPGVEQQILNAAQKLWQEGGEKALTMRAIARIAGTNTPTIYRRFKNRNDILFALTERVQQDLLRALQASRSPEETCMRYVEFASSHPHEYNLFHAHKNELSQSLRSHSRSALWNSTPMVKVIRKQLAERLGGSVAEHTRLSLALWVLAHGTATLLISKGIPTKQVGALRSAFADALDTLVDRGIPADSDLWLR
jgi:AcrR family transcriptional regulator